MAAEMDELTGDDRGRADKISVILYTGEMRQRDGREERERERGRGRGEGRGRGRGGVVLRGLHHKYY